VAIRSTQAIAEAAQFVEDAASRNSVVELSGGRKAHGEVFAAASKQLVVTASTLLLAFPGVNPVSRATGGVLMTFGPTNLLTRRGG
jgi:hypothetical protein